MWTRKAVQQIKVTEGTLKFAMAVAALSGLCHLKAEAFSTLGHYYTRSQGIIAVTRGISGLSFSSVPILTSLSFHNGSALF